LTSSCIRRFDHGGTTPSAASRPCRRRARETEWVVVLELDEVRAGPVTRLDDGDGKLAMRGLRLHDQRLTRRHSERRLHDGVGVASELRRLEYLPVFHGRDGSWLPPGSR